MIVFFIFSMIVAWVMLGYHASRDEDAYAWIWAVAWVTNFCAAVLALSKVIQ